MRINIRIEIESDNGINKSSIDTMYVVGPISEYYIEKGSIYPLLNEALNAAYANYRANLISPEDKNSIKGIVLKSKITNASLLEKVTESEDKSGNIKRWITLDDFASVMNLKKLTMYLKLKKEENNKYGSLTYEGITYECKKIGKPWFVNYSIEKKTASE